jgi:hypothetical protein
MTIIHRDGSFTVAGKRFFTGKGSDRPERDGSCFIAEIRSDRPGDYMIIAEGFHQALHVV